MTRPPTFTDEELVTCAKRELDYRRRHYPKWLEQGRMTQEFADRQIAMMEAIVERLKPDLFKSATAASD